MGYCDCCLSAGSVNPYGYCEICGAEHEPSGEKRGQVVDMSAVLESAGITEAA